MDSGSSFSSLFGNKALWESPGVLIGIGLPALLLIWFLRIVGKDIARHNDLEADASERVAMVQTFLALEYKGEAGKEERVLVLANLFRPSAITHDDAAPSTLLDIVLKPYRKT